MIQGFVNSDRACASALLKSPEREKFVAFSDVLMRIYSPGLIARPGMAETVRSFSDDQGVDLYELIIRNPIIVGRQEGRRYGQQIDEALSRLSDYFPDRIRNSSADEGAARVLMKLLMHERIDVMFGYAHELEYVGREMGQKLPLSYTPVRGATRFIDVYVGCPKTDWGQRVIKGVNAVLADADIRERMAGFYADWLDPATRREYLASY